MPSTFSPLARAVLDSLAEGVVVFDPDGMFVYANAAAQSTISDLGSDSIHARQLMPRLARLGARVAPMWIDGTKQGEAVYLPAPGGAGKRTLAEREQDAILETLENRGWKLSASARCLGISRTTLWRRLKAYGLQRDSHGRWFRPS